MLRIPRSVYLFAIVAFLAGCGIFGKAERKVALLPPYSPQPDLLGEDYFHSPAGDVAARYPKNWLHVDIRTIPMQNVLEVYTDEARSKALVLAEIPATAEFRREVERDGMEALANQSFASKSAKVSGKLAITRPTQIYSENGKLFASYEYAEAASDSLHRKENRIVLFTTGSKFYELGMIELEAPQSTMEHAQNFRILESVIASLEGVAEVQADTTLD